MITVKHGGVQMIFRSCFRAACSEKRSRIKGIMNSLSCDDRSKLMLVLIYSKVFSHNSLDCLAIKFVDIEGEIHGDIFLFPSHNPLSKWLHLRYLLKRKCLSLEIANDANIHSRLVKRLFYSTKHV